MVRKTGFWLLWAGFIAYAFLFAPPDRPDTLELIQNLSTGNWAGINPAIIALFNLMGIWPMIYASLLFVDGCSQKISAWPFVVGSFGLGAFVLLPYLALRQPNQAWVGHQNWILKFWNSRWLGGAIALGTIVLLAYGLGAGDWSDFRQQWQTSRFIHVMSLDFCLLCGLFPSLLGDDMARRGLQDRRIFWAVTLLPLVGSAFYLLLRPALPSASTPEPDVASQPKPEASLPS